jgi:hypothetical protein
MTSRHGPAGPDRRLAALAALVMLAGTLLPWFAWSGALPSNPVRGWEGSGALVALAAVGVLALLALPWAGRGGEVDERRIGSVLARSLPWLLLVGVAVIGLVVWPLAWLDAPEGLLPHRAPGLYIAAAGTVLLAFVAWRSGGSVRPR